MDRDRHTHTHTHTDAKIESKRGNWKSRNRKVRTRIEVQGFVKTTKSQMQEGKRGGRPGRGRGGVYV